MELHQITKLLDSKGNHHQNEKATKQPPEWEKIFANHTADNDKGLISKVLDIYIYIYIYIYIHTHTHILYIYIKLIQTS